MSCQTGKEAFPNAQVAHSVARRTARKRKRPVHAYRCPYCGQYHTGSKAPKGYAVKNKGKYAAKK